MSTSLGPARNRTKNKNAQVGQHSNDTHSGTAVGQSNNDTQSSNACDTGGQITIEIQQTDAVCLVVDDTQRRTATAHLVGQALSANHPMSADKVHVRKSPKRRGEAITHLLPISAGAYLPPTALRDLVPVQEDQNLIQLRVVGHAYRFKQLQSAVGNLERQIGAIHRTIEKNLVKHGHVSIDTHQAGAAGAVLSVKTESLNQAYFDTQTPAVEAVHASTDIRSPFDGLDHDDDDTQPSNVDSDHIRPVTRVGAVEFNKNADDAQPSHAEFGQGPCATHYARAETADKSWKCENGSGQLCDATQYTHAGLISRAVNSDAEILTVAAAQPLITALEGLKPLMAEQEKMLKRYADKLDVAKWVKSVPGAGMVNLGLIIGNTGPLDAYANPAKVWKRMGLAVINGKSQRRVSRHRKEKTGDENVADAVEQGYSPRRRSIMWNLGECLLKQNFTGKSCRIHDDFDDECGICTGRRPGYYRQVFEDRLRYKLDQLGATEYNKKDGKHVHAKKDAHRYMEKRFLLHLWQAWRDTHSSKPQPGK